MHTQHDSAAYDVGLSPQVGTILVAVNGRPSGWEALDWAAAETAVCGVALRIVHVVAPPIPILDPFAGMIVEWREAGHVEHGVRVLDEARRRARVIAGDVPISTHLVAGGVASSIRQAVQNDSLIVVGRGKGSPLGLASTGWRVARRAGTKVAVVELKGMRPSGRSVGQVVVAMTDRGGPPAAIAYAFRAAARRGTALTVIDGCAPTPHGTTTINADGCGVNPRATPSALDPTFEYRNAYPEVQVGRRHVAQSVAAAVAGESGGAALLVIGAPRHGLLHHALFSSAAHRAVRWAHCTVVIIPSKERAKSR